MILLIIKLKRLNFNRLKYLLVSFLLIFTLLSPYLVNNANATAPTGFLRIDRMATTTATGGTICLTPQTTATEGKVVVTFPATGASADATHFGVNQTAGNWTVTTTNLPTGSTI